MLLRFLISFRYTGIKIISKKNIIFPSTIFSPLIFLRRYKLLKNTVNSAILQKLNLSLFLQDISDRVEKDEPSSSALRALETNHDKVVRGDWRLHIDVEVATDLRKYRSYRGESVRDLLRALRNKVI